MANEDNRIYSHPKNSCFTSLNIHAPSFIPTCNSSNQLQMNNLKLGKCNKKSGLAVKKNFNSKAFNMEIGDTSGVRCLEKSKGGLKYELLLEPIKKRRIPVSKKSSVEEIRSRYRSIQESRTVLHEEKLIFTNIKEKGECYNSFIHTTPEGLIRKTEPVKEQHKVIALKYTQDKTKDQTLTVYKDNESPVAKDFIIEDLLKKMESTITAQKAMNNKMKETFENMNQANENLLKRIGEQKQCKFCQIMPSIKPLLNQLWEGILNEENAISEDYEKIIMKQSSKSEENIATCGKSIETDII